MLILITKKSQETFLSKKYLSKYVVVSLKLINLYNYILLLNYNLQKNTWFKLTKPFKDEFQQTALPILPQNLRNKHTNETIGYLTPSNENKVLQLLRKHNMLSSCHDDAVLGAAHQQWTCPVQPICVSCVFYTT